MQIAQTPVVLFSQMFEQGRAEAEIDLVHRAYDLGVELYSARFEADGSPFQVHGVGTASILADLGMPAWVLAAACIHNVYGTGDFGDGRRFGAHRNRRTLVRNRIGDEAEAFVADLFSSRLDRQSIASLLDRAADMSERERMLLTHDLADLLEKWFDGGILYARPDRSDRRFVEGHEESLVVLANRLGYPALANALDDAFARVRNAAAPNGLSWDRTYSRIIVPRSLTRRFVVRCLSRGRSLYHLARRTIRSWR